VIENPRTGEQIEIVSDGPDVLVMLATWTRPGHRAIEHVHPAMEERWTVLDGRAAFRVDGVAVDAAPGTVVVAPPGRRHLAWNPTEDVVRLRIEMRPPRRWAEFTTRLFGGEDPALLLSQYPDEIALP
jgi:quercetin dioxygenase-like cupin family protein